MINETFGHQGRFGDFVLRNISSWNDFDGSADWLDAELRRCFFDERSADFTAVLEDDVVAIVATFHLCIRSKDVVEKSFGGHGSCSRKVRSDDAASVTDLVTGKAGGEEGFAFCGITLLVCKAVVFVKFLTRGFGRLRSD